ncbi:MAG: alkaline phosphatase family protein [Planctomycetota bacterium]|nr:alkaline phosphatase family protein [Planctomycetota bacterium]
MYRSGIVQFFSALLLGSSLATQTPVENVVLVTIDGLRWQEVFSGAENQLMNKDSGGVKDLLRARRLFWRGTPQARRELLMPFFWRKLVPAGQLFGNPEHNSKATVTNKHLFSYPGYNELLTGRADPRIASNQKLPNPNVTVLEWLHDMPAYQGRVASFTCWDVFPYIINSERSKIPVNAGWAPITEGDDPTRIQTLQELSDSLPRYWAETVRYDGLTYLAAVEYLKKHKPRVLYLALGETDDWAHARRYDLYLAMAQRCDRFLGELWDLLQSMPTYKDKTALVITTDHGRGDGAQWTDHSKDVPGSENLWIAVTGPGVVATGERRDVAVTQAQVASTVAHLLGHDFCASFPQAARPLPGLDAKQEQHEQAERPGKQR